MNTYTIAIETFAELHPAEALFLHEKQTASNFAASLAQALIKYGSLTERQLTALQSWMAKEVAQVAAANPVNAPTVSVDKLKDAFAAAGKNGLKKPVLRFDGFCASLAPSSGKNPGGVYIKGHDTVYYGKITNSKFWASAAAPNGIDRMVIHAMEDPIAMAIAYGKRTGRCSCCGRTLTDPVSVENGIGPVCATKFGW